MVHARGSRALLVSLLLTVASHAMAEAETSRCVTGYKQANADFFNQITELEGQVGTADIVKYSAAGGGLICLVGAPSLVIKGACVLGAAVIGVPAQMHSDSANRQVASLKESLPHEESFLIYQAYSAKRSGLQAMSPEVTYLLAELGLEPARADDALIILTQLMESGELCGADNRPAVTYDRLVELIRSRL